MPIKHLLRREEAVSEDYDWLPGLDEPSALSITTSDAQDAPLLLRAPEQKYHGPLRIVLLGQNGVGKSSLALSLAGLSDRSLSIDSETQASGKDNFLYFSSYPVGWFDLLEILEIPYQPFETVKICFLFHKILSSY